MSNLKKYLNENHPNVDYDNLKSDFSEKFGVNVKQEGEFFLFKYGMISAVWAPVTLECRGSILKLTEDGWKFQSRPFDKFFNQHEGHCPIFKEKDFKEALRYSALVAKADGSCIQLWHDGEKWRISTLGTITPLNVQDSNFTFADLFLTTASEIFWDELDVDNTYLFELCTEHNRIVTQYQEDHVVFLGARNRITGVYLSNIELDNELNCGAFRHANAVLPQLVFPWEIGLKSLEAVKQFIEEESKTDRYGKYSEGFVLYDWRHFHPLAKMKNAQYVSLHCFGGGDLLHSKNQIIEAIFLGYVDDIYDVLSDQLKSFAEDIKHKVSSLESNAISESEKIQEMNFETRKDYAIFIKNNLDSKIQAFFFKNANDFMEKKAMDVSAKFEFWLKENYKKFEWKE